MAGKKRDYKAEYARRNALAKERGYKSYGRLRRLIETGSIAPIAPKRVRSAKTTAAQRERQRREGTQRETWRGNADIFKWPTITDSQRATDWSTIFAKDDAAKFDPKDTDSPFLRAAKERYIRQHGQQAYTNAYLAAFVSGDERYRVVRHKGGSDALRHWLVDVVQYMTAEEYDGKYGEAN